MVLSVVGGTRIPTILSVVEVVWLAVGLPTVEVVRFVQNSDVVSPKKGEKGGEEGVN